MLGGLLGSVTSHGGRHGNNTWRGAAIGGALGGMVGCWTAHEQAVAAAREDRLNASAAELDQITEQLHQYNEELAQKIDRLRNDLASARAMETRLASGNTYRRHVLAEQENAREQLRDVSDALANVGQKMEAFNSGSLRYDSRSEAYRSQQAELFAAQSKLQEILSFQA